MSKGKLTKLDISKICADADAILEKSRYELRAYRKSIPQTPEDWQYLTGLYDAKMLKDRKIISKLQEGVNKLRQKLKNSHRVPKSDIEELDDYSEEQGE